MVVNVKISVLVVMCASLLCLQSCSKGSYIPIFTVKKIEQEAGQLFKLKTTVKDGKGKDAEHRTGFDFIRLQLEQDSKETDFRLRQWGNHDDNIIFSNRYKTITRDNGATRQYNNLYYLQAFSGTLVASVFGVTYSGSNENSLPLEITANRGIKGVFTLNDATDELTLQLSNAEPLQQYKIDLADNINYLDYGVAKIADADADGKINSSWTLTSEIDKQKVCEAEFAAKVASNESGTDDIRIISTVLEFPCLREHDRDISVNNDGSVLFGDRTAQINCYGADYKEAEVRWSYAEYDKYPAGKTENGAYIYMDRKKTQLGSIADYKPDELCYYIVVKGKYKCSERNSSSGGSIGARALHGKCAATP